jgi:hypothetical protein
MVSRKISRAKEKVERVRAGEKGAKNKICRIFRGGYPYQNHNAP